MRRGMLFLLCALAFGQAELRDPFDRAVQASQQARARGDFAEAAAQREEARKLLEQMPIDEQQGAFRVQNLAQAYQMSGWHAKARAVVQEALNRAGTLPQWHPAHIQLLNSLAEFWWQDGNWLKAVAYREKAAAAVEAAPAGASTASAQPPAARLGTTLANGASRAILVNGIFDPAVGAGSNNAYIYQQLANWYRQLGRPEDAAKALVKMRSLIQKDPGALAQSYAQEGDVEKAIALYQQQATTAAANPQAKLWDIAGPYQSMASLYESQQRWNDAVAALQQAASRLDASGEAASANQADSLRLRIAGLLQRSGQTQAAEQAYQALLSPNGSGTEPFQTQALQEYANFLAGTGRGPQGGQLLKDYLGKHADLPAWQESNLLMSLSQVARRSGQNDVADQYQREATEKQRASQPERREQPVVGPLLQQAQRAISEGNNDEALSLALRAIAAAPTAPDGDSVAWLAPNVANNMALSYIRKAPDKAEQIYSALMTLVEARSVDTVTPLHDVQQQYARFLMKQKDRLGDASLAIDRFQESAIAARGADTEAALQVQQLRLELAQAKGDQQDASQQAEGLLAIEKALSGATSIRYMRTAETAVNVYQAAGRIESALALHREIIAIADRTSVQSDAQRGFVRLNAARAFAMARQFEEAAKLANEAVAIGETMRPPRPELFRGQAEGILKMKDSPQPNVAPEGPGARWQIPTQIRIAPVPPPQ